MPRSRPTVFPPTPAPSTDITGKTCANAIQFDTTFALPPAAIGGTRSSTSSTTTSNHGSESSYRPLSPTSPAAKSKKTVPPSRKRAASIQGGLSEDEYSLPPPPMRPRKIIQMDPKKSQELANTNNTPGPTSTTAKAPAGTGAGTKRKQAGATTAQGRKMARKTAHSLIERRRRSKMNDEFGVLKDMIPGCKDQDMHKLSILQASIEYTRYLEQCVSDLKASYRSRRTPIPPSHNQPPIPRLGGDDVEDDDGEDDEDEDHERSHMEDVISTTHSNVSPAIYPSDRSMHSTTTSPRIYPLDAYHPSATTSPSIHPLQPRNSSITSSIRSAVASTPLQTPHAAFGPQTPPLPHFRDPFSPVASSSASRSAPRPGQSKFVLISPALEAQKYREDHEATEALLMLNTDRRSWSAEGKRGMSVKDILSG